jgi:hypothetical protein
MMPDAGTKELTAGRELTNIRLPSADQLANSKKTDHWRRRRGDWRVLRSVAALFVMALVPGSGCDDEAPVRNATESGVPADANNDLAEDDASAAGGSAGQGPGTGGSGGIAPPMPDRISSDDDAGRECVALVVGQRQQTLPTGVCSDAGAVRVTYACLPPPVVGMTCREAYTDACALYTYECGRTQHGTRVLCGPIEDRDGNCCYVTTGECVLGF